MSLNAVLSNALSGLNMAQRSLTTISNNISNVDTEGYTTKSTTQSTVVAGGVTMGVRGGDVARSVDTLLQKEQRTATGKLSALNVIDDVYNQLQLSSLGSTTNNIGDIVSAFQTAVTTLSNDPTSSSARSAVVSTATQVADAIGTSATLIQTLRGNADQQIGDQVSEINDQLKQLQDLNAQFSSGSGSADLEDKRDALLDSLAAKLNITSTVKDNGSVQVFAPNGTTLLDDKARVLTYEPATTVARGTSFGAITIYTQGQIDTATGKPRASAAGSELVSAGTRSTATGTDQIQSSIGSGSLAGLLAVRDTILPGLDDQLMTMADGITSTMNAVHNDASPVPLPTTVTGSRTDTSAYAGATRSGTFAMAVIDPDTGATTGSASVDIADYGSMGDLVAALNTQLAGTATVSIDASGSLAIASADGKSGIAIDNGDSNVTFTDGSGTTRSQSLGQYLGLNDLFTVSAGSPTDFAVRSDVAGNPSLLSGAGVTAAAPGSDWSIGGTGDGSGFQALATAFTAKTIVADGSTTRQSVVDYVANTTTTLAAKTSASSSALANQQSISTALDERQSGIAGVNIDEELAKLITFQQAYSAAAQMISTSNDLFDKLMSSV